LLEETGLSGGGPLIKNTKKRKKGEKAIKC